MSERTTTVVPKLSQRPEAKTLRVSDLLERVRRGALRIPEFQRPLRWRAKHVLALLDSVYQGYPIGELLFSSRDAAAEHVTFGPWSTEAAAVRDAWFVVDGQQRVTALVGSLLHPRRRPRQGSFALWFNLEDERFERVVGAEAPAHWIPVNVLSELRLLSEWLDDWLLRRDRPELVARARSVQQALLDYTMPAYLVAGDNEPALRRIFQRINTHGVGMNDEEVFEALYQHGGRRPLEQARRRLHDATGFGLLSASLFLRTLKAVHNVNAQSAARDLDREEALLQPDAVATAERALVRVVEFLREDAGVPDAFSLPYRSPPLILLARFFALHPSPSGRTRVLLSRWVWRSALSHDHNTASQGMINAGQKLLVAGDEHSSAQALLRSATTPKSFPTPSLPWNRGSADVRACMLAMLAQGNTPLDGGDPEVEVDEDTPSQGDGGDGGDGGEFHFVALTGKKPARVVDAFVTPVDAPLNLLRADGETLRAQMVTDEALDALRRDAQEEFYRLREAEMAARFDRFFRERCGVGDSDRIAIEAIEARVEASLRP